jgi:hypothetical protein
VNSSYITSVVNQDQSYQVKHYELSELGRLLRSTTLSKLDP